MKKPITLKSFKELKDYLNPSYSTKERLSDEEVFKRAMADVREIREFREVSITKKKVEISYKKIKDEAQETRELLVSLVAGNVPIRLSDTGEYIEWVNKGARKDLCERIHRGDFSIQDYIDLHGMTRSEAELEVERFLKSAIIKGYRSVKIIHGRGLRSPRGPILKTALEKWLQGKFRKFVLAYVTSRDKDGGLGATYVILTRNL